MAHLAILTQARIRNKGYNDFKLLGFEGRKSFNLIIPCHLIVRMTKGRLYEILMTAVISTGLRLNRPNMIKTMFYLINTVMATFFKQEKPNE